MFLLPRAAALKATIEEALESSVARGSPAGSGGSPEPDNNWSAPDALSPGSARDDDEDDDKSHASERGYVVPVRGETASGEFDSDFNKAILGLCYTSYRIPSPDFKGYCYSA